MKRSRTLSQSRETRDECGPDWAGVEHHRPWRYYFGSYHDDDDEQHEWGYRTVVEQYDELCQAEFTACVQFLSTLVNADIVDDDAILGLADTAYDAQKAEVDRYGGQVDAYRAIVREAIVHVFPLALSENPAPLPTDALKRILLYLVQSNLESALTQM
jgi:hypothetical protein